MRIYVARVRDEARDGQLERRMRMEAQVSRNIRVKMTLLTWNKTGTKALRLYETPPDVLERGNQREGDDEL